MRKHFANTRAVRQGSSPNRAEGVLCPRLSGAESGGVTGTQANHSPNRAGAYYVPGSVVQSPGGAQVHKLINKLIISAADTQY